MPGGGLAPHDKMAMRWGALLESDRVDDLLNLAG
jgi:hypothetical protein